MSHGYYDNTYTSEVMDTLIMFRWCSLIAVLIGIFVLKHRYLALAWGIAFGWMGGLLVMFGFMLLIDGGDTNKYTIPLHIGLMLIALKTTWFEQLFRCCPEPEQIPRRSRRHQVDPETRWQVYHRFVDALGRLYCYACERRINWYNWHCARVCCKHRTYGVDDYRPMCNRCDSQKGNMSLLQFIRWMFPENLTPAKQASLQRHYNRRHH